MSLSGAKDVGIDTLDHRGNTALIEAASLGCLDRVKLLLANGADPNIPGNNSGYTALHWAIVHDRFEIFEELLKNNANPNAKNHNGKTPLHTAVIYKNAKFIQMLLDANADVDIQDNDGYTPITSALLGRYDLMIPAILAMFAKSKNITHKDNYGHTLLSRISRDDGIILKPLLRQIIETLINATTNIQDQLFKNIEQVYQIEFSTAEEVLDWVMISPIDEDIQNIADLPADSTDRRKIVEWFEMLYSNYQIESRPSLLWTLLNAESLVGTSQDSNVNMNISSHEDLEPISQCSSSSTGLNTTNASQDSDDMDTSWSEKEADDGDNEYLELNKPSSTKSSLNASRFAAPLLFSMRLDPRASSGNVTWESRSGSSVAVVPAASTRELSIDDTDRERKEAEDGDEIYQKCSFANVDRIYDKYCNIL